MILGLLEAVSLALFLATIAIWAILLQGAHLSF